MLTAQDFSVIGSVFAGEFIRQTLKGYGNKIAFESAIFNAAQVVGSDLLETRDAVMALKGTRFTGTYLDSDKFKVGYISWPPMDTIPYVI